MRGGSLFRAGSGWARHRQRGLPQPAASLPEGAAGEAHQKLDFWAVKNPLVRGVCVSPAQVQY